MRYLSPSFYLADVARAHSLYRVGSLAGMNYADHCTEQNLPIPVEPVVFAKFGNAVCDPGADINGDDTKVRILTLLQGTNKRVAIHI